MRESNRRWSKPLRRHLGSLLERRSTHAYGPTADVLNVSVIDGDSARSMHNNRLCSHAESVKLRCSADVEGAFQKPRLEGWGRRDYGVRACIRLSADVIFIRWWLLFQGLWDCQPICSRESFSCFFLPKQSPDRPFTWWRLRSI